MNTFVYIAAGAGPHPTVILLHGLPGNERNLDLAQSIRRAGWNVIYFDYRGSWGSPGNFSFTHCIEDTQSAIAYLRDPGNAANLRSDPRIIVLIGHSLGGFMALQASALDSTIKAVVTISATDLGISRLQAVPADKQNLAIDGLAAGLVAEGMAPLAGTTAEILCSEVLGNAKRWNLVNLAPKLATKPLLVITSDDGFSAPNDEFVEAVKNAGDQEVDAVRIPTDHSYSDHVLLYSGLFSTDSPTSAINNGPYILARALSAFRSLETSRTRRAQRRKYCAGFEHSRLRCHPVE